MPHFGPRVIGEEQYRQQSAKQAIGAHHFGPRVVGQPVAPPPSPAPAPAAPQPLAGVSLDDMAALLKENPSFVDRLIKDEFVRPQGPRKDALVLLLASEEHNSAYPARAGVVARLQDALGLTAEAEPAWDTLTVAQLTQLAADWQVSLDEFEGTGAGGKLVKNDLIGILQEAYTHRAKAQE